MATLQVIQEKNTIYGIVWRKGLRTKGVRFLTPQSYPLQVGLLEHPAGKQIRAHRHRDIKYKVNTTQEFLYVERGEVEATIYRLDWTIFKKIILKAGDFLLTTCGGHGFRVRKAARIIEIKQGPYPGDSKAKFFKPEA